MQLQTCSIAYNYQLMCFIIKKFSFSRKIDFQFFQFNLIFLVKKTNIFYIIVYSIKICVGNLRNKNTGYYSIHCNFLDFLFFMFFFFGKMKKKIITVSDPALSHFQLSGSLLNAIYEYKIGRWNVLFAGACNYGILKNTRVC